ncbi:TetR/AcrR family transcriptional regulator [Streptomyces sp. GC420]|uniref:TetR/AcrR family transcriptional regulator n=1 Tax=Streptomyces sp. GC420 TaxID=2697568 RepID=UPI001414CC5A|nr:TetR/AcrR family transcriptional regulator [Streptomyces sp. GC420]NBM18990.1 TetR family transcriptional regulator [Streptomyces sp. GC420]
MDVVTPHAGTPHGTRHTGTPPPAAGNRAPKQDRSRATRQRLLEAAVSCLAEHGWAGSTVSVVAERAGVSRGAAQHHFPTREDLFTAAVEYVAEERSQALRTLFTDGRAGRGAAGGHGRPPAPAPREAVLRALVELFTGPLFRAALHLWVAASNEEPLRSRVTELEARVGRETHRIAVELLGADETLPGVRETIQGLLDMARGLGLANLLTDDTARRERVVAQWATVVDGLLGAPEPGAPGTPAGQRPAQR